MSDSDLHRSIDALKDLLGSVPRGEFSDKLGKIAVYAESILNRWELYQATVAALDSKGDKDPTARDRETQAKARAFEAALKNSLRFMHINLDAALVQALESVVWRPRIPSKTDEVKKAQALQRAFDRLEDPDKAMLEHYHTSSDPLNKYLVAGPWGHEYLRKRKIDLERYDRELCRMLACEDSAAGRMVQEYARIRRAIDRVEESALSAIRIHFPPG